MMGGPYTGHRLGQQGTVYQLMHFLPLSTSLLPEEDNLVSQASDQGGYYFQIQSSPFSFVGITFLFLYHTALLKVCYIVNPYT
jgi:hypothetical protein